MDVRLCGPKALWPPQSVVRLRGVHRGGDRRSAEHHRRYGCRRQGRRLHPHRRVGVHGRGRVGLGRPHQSCLCRTRSTKPCSEERQPEPSNSCTASRPSTTGHGGRRAHPRKIRLDAMEVTDDVFESKAVDRLRSGRKSHAHHQVDPRGHDGLTATREGEGDASRSRTRRQRAAAAGRNDDRRRAAAQRPQIAAAALAPLARQHQLVLSHGNGPQIGLLALQAGAYNSRRAVSARRARRRRRRA